MATAQERVGTKGQSASERLGAIPRERRKRERERLRERVSTGRVREREAGLPVGDSSGRVRETEWLQRAPGSEEILK